MSYGYGDHALSTLIKIVPLRHLEKLRYTMSSPKLFTPIKIGPYNLGHRIVLAPLTRCRANSKHVHGPLAVEYYSQRASVSPRFIPKNIN